MAQAALDGAPERFALAGHSMGGRVALEIMRCSPGRVSRIGLIDTASGPLQHPVKPVNMKGPERFALRNCPEAGHAFSWPGNGYRTRFIPSA